MRDLTNAKFKIYAITCPKSKQVKYVGRTSKDDVRVRIMEHISSNYSNDELVSWLKSINGAPVIVILEKECIGRKYSHERELYWISRLAGEGHNLLNKCGLNGNYMKKLNMAQVLDLSEKLNGKNSVSQFLVEGKTAA